MNIVRTARVRLLVGIFVWCVFLCTAQAEVVVIDDFEGELNAETVDFGAGGGSAVTATASEDIVHNGNQSLKIGYTAVTDGYMWIARGYRLDVKGAAQWLVEPHNIDWPQYTSFSFYMYGENSGSQIAVDIIDAGFEYWRFMVQDDFMGWKHIVCPLEDFFPRADWQPDASDVNAELNFPVFAYQFEPRTVHRGVVYIDYIHLIGEQE